MCFSVYRTHSFSLWLWLNESLTLLRRQLLQQQQRQQKTAAAIKKKQKPTAAVFKVATVIHLAASNWRSLNSKLKTENRKPKTQSQNETSTSADSSDSDSDSAASSALGLFGIDLTPCRLNLWSESAPESPSPSRIQRLKRSWSRCSALLSLPVCR